MFLTKNYRIFFSNIGYAKGINGGLKHHLLYAYRHFYCPPHTQEKVLSQLDNLIKKENPDLCCFVEIDKNLDQLSRLTENYDFFDIENKYGENSWLRTLTATKGKCNAFMTKTATNFGKFYFDCGVKRLIYKINLEENLTVFFAHFSLNKSMRQKQLLQVKQIFSDTKGEVVFLGDFNILKGLRELEPLLGENLILLNDPTKMTFNFHRSFLLLDLCLCTKNIAPFLNLTVHPQPYSDHAALTLDIKARESPL